MNNLENTYKIYIFALKICVFNCGCYLQFWITVADCFLQCVRSNWLRATFIEINPIFVFSIFVREFIVKSSGKKSFRIRHVRFDQNSSSELNIVHFIA